jgi:hypothetical protein
MTTLVYPPSGALGFGRSRTVGVVRKPLVPADAAILTAVLAEVGIPVRVETGPIVHLYALGPVSTRQEARALAAVCSVTDCRICWHAAVA